MQPSGSLNSLSKGLVATFSTQAELGQDVLALVQQYIEKHTPPSESDRARLHEELLSIHRNHISGSKNAAFLHILKLLKHDFLIEADQCRTWWNLMLFPILNHTEHLKETMKDSLDICLEGLVFKDDDPEFKTRYAAAEAMKSCILEAYFSAVLMERRSVADNLEFLLVTFARRRTQDFFETINPYLQNPSHRLQSLTLLSTFVRLQTQYIYQIFDTSLLNSLLQCLEHDGSTTVVSLALTVLIMIVPHIPDKLATMLPRLFHIFGRILCWDKLNSVQKRTAALVDIESAPDHHAEDLSIISSSHEEGAWRRLDASFDIAHSTPPKCSQYFTFLYGLYPINFLEYLRAPSSFNTSAHGQSWYEPEDIFDDDMIRSRASPLIRRHLIHPNFANLTLESEISDSNRWMKLEPSDVVTLCISLDTVNISSQSRITEDDPMRRTLDDDIEELDLHRTTQNSPSCDRVASGYESEESRFNQSPILASIHERSNERLPPSMMASFISDKNEPTAASRLASPAFLPTKVSGLTRHGTNMSRHSSTSRKDVLSPTDVLRLHEELVLLDLQHNSQNDETNHDFNLKSTTSQYQRELLLLRNELNFERHLKQQHLQHIGRLQRDVVSDAAVETERQNLYNTTKALKSQVSNLQKILQRLRTETATSKSNRAKYEASLNERIKKLREEKTSLFNNEEGLKMALEEAKNDILQMRMSLGVAEGVSLNLRQQLQVLQPEIQEAKDLQKNFNLLKERMKDVEIQQLQLTLEKERAREAESREKASAMALLALKAEYEEHLLSEKESRKALAIPLAPVSKYTSAVDHSATTVLYEKMLALQSSKQSQEYNALDSRHQEILGKYRAMEEKVNDYEARLEYNKITSAGQTGTPRRPELTNRAYTNFESSSRAAQESALPGPSAGGPSAPSLSTSRNFAERVAVSSDQSPARGTSSPSYVHGARRTDTLADQGHNGSTSPVPQSPGTPTRKKESKEKAVLGGRFRW